MFPLVAPSSVAQQLGSPALILLDATLPPVGAAPAVSPEVRYLEEHLPGAVFFDIDALSDRAATLPHMLPSAERFSRDMATLGVGSDVTMIVYEQGDVFSAPRARWMLRSFGVREVYLLDGGLRAWREAGLPTESGPVCRAAANFHARLRPEAVTSYANVQALVARVADTEARESAAAQILDARSKGRFDGAAPEPRSGLRSGHMPGAINVPFTTLIDGNRMKSKEQLRAVLLKQGVDLEQPAIATCGSGVTAAVVALALELCGAPAASLYDGSWAEYAQQPAAVIQNVVTKAAGA